MLCDTVCKIDKGISIFPLTSANFYLVSSGFSNCFSFLPPQNYKKEAYADYDLHYRGRGNGKPYMEQGNGGLLTHDPRDRYPYSKRAYNALQHNEGRSSAPVEIAHKAKQKRGEYTVYRIRFLIFRRTRNGLRLLREKTRKKLAVEKCKIEHRDTDSQR